MEKTAKLTLEKNVVKCLLSTFDKRKLSLLARKVGFVQRKSKLKPLDFLMTLLFAKEGKKATSLLDLANELGYKFNTFISPQSLHERFNQSAVNFLQSLIGMALESKLEGFYKGRFLNQFTAVKIQDSTSFQLPKSLSNYYSGCGGASTGAMARVQFEYDLRSGQISTLDLTPGQLQDATYASKGLDKVAPGNLLIRDLGFWNLKFMEGVMDKGGYVVSRLKPLMLVSAKNKGGEWNQLDFCEVLRKMEKHGLNVLEHTVQLSKKASGPWRLVAYRVDEKTYQERIRKAQKEAKKRGGMVSKEYKARARLNLFVTNLNEKMMPKEKLYSLYQLRWQIELIFKTWKSQWGLAQIKPMKKERVECYIYARLLFIVLSWRVFQAINKSLSWSSDEQILSYQKFGSLFLLITSELSSALKKGKKGMEKLVKTFLNITLKRQQFVEQKKNKHSSMSIFKTLNDVDENIKSFLKMTA